jgi:hypothetical protein
VFQGSADWQFRHSPTGKGLLHFVALTMLALSLLAEREQGV